MIGYSYDQYHLKRKLDRLQKWGILISLILDIGMIVCAGYGIKLSASTPDYGICHTAYTLAFVYSISGVCIIRCLNVLILVMYILIIPCFMCSDDCCLKRALVKEKPAPREVIRQLKHNWTWRHSS